MKRFLCLALIIFISLISLSGVSAHGADITDDTMITVYKFKSNGDVEHQLEHALTNPNKRILAIAYQDTVESYLDDHTELKDRVLVCDDDESSIADSSKKLVEIDVGESSGSDNGFITPLVVGLVVGLLIGIIVGAFAIKRK